MNNKKLVLALIGLALLLALVYVVVQSQQPKKTEGTAEVPVPVANFETILIGKGGAKWSPDGTKLAFISEDGGLTITDAEGKGEIKKVAQRNFGTFDWLDSATFLATSSEYKEENGKKVAEIWKMKTISTNGRESLIVEDIAPYRQEHNISVPHFLKDGTVGYYEGRFTLPGKDKIFKVIKKGKLKPQDATKELRAVTRGDIWLESIDRTIKRKITSGTYYRGAQLSPDGSKIMTKNSRGDILILDLEGRVLNSLGTGVYEGWSPDKGTGEQAKWSPDGKQIVYALKVPGGEDGQFIVASELYIVNWDGTGKTQITNTPDEIESDPTWSPDGTKILCGSLETNKIFVIKVK
ncbi:MAG: hypothetical protein MUP17_10935 [candidate division Zixibacteria bacterium]|nr:hypothetical protein [candidate division Zixibacteria bacterium]